jgi:hypothetical protein|tara:strand:- start:2061 stop:2432 length:372 start_codon:yes stop_codon:yes gene_type:complete
MNEIDRLQKLAGIVNEDGEPGVDYKSDTGEGDVEKQAVGHIDNERGMIMKNLYLIGKASIDMHQMLKELPDSDFPHWWQSKIVKAQNYLDGARNYLDAELNSPRGDMPEEPETVDVEDPSGVS